MSIYGYAGILNDGRQVVAHYGSPYISFGSAAPIPLDDWLMFVRAVTGPDGKGYAVGKGNGYGQSWLVCEDGRTLHLGTTFGNMCVAMAVTGERLNVLVQTSATAYTLYGIDPTSFFITEQKSLPVDLNRAQGLAGVENGEPVLYDPIYRTIAGRKVGYVYPCPATGRTVSQDNATGCPMLSDGRSIGPLSPTGGYEQQLSANGLWWVQRGDHEVVSGPVPAVIPPVSDPLPPPSFDIPSFAPLGRKVGRGLFTVTRRTGESADLPGHFEILTDGAQWKDCVNHTRPVIADLLSQASVPDDKLYAIYQGYEAGSGADQFRRAAFIAETRHVPVIWYDDFSGFRYEVFEPFVRRDDWLMVRGYPPDASTFFATIASVASKHDRLALASPDYTQAWGIPDAFAMQRHIDRALRMYPQIDLVGHFCGIRLNGVTTYPELMTSYLRALAASSGLPSNWRTHPQPSPVPPPPVPTSHSINYLTAHLVQEFNLWPR